MAEDFLKRRKELEYKFLEKAEKDKKFKKKLMEDPYAAADDLKLSLPKEFKFKIMEEKKGERILVIPYLPIEDELSDLQMVQAAGGKGGASTQNVNQATTEEKQS